MPVVFHEHRIPAPRAVGRSPYQDPARASENALTVPYFATGSSSRKRGDEEGGSKVGGDSA